MLILIEKVLLQYPYFFRLENILGDRPNVGPPATVDLGSGEGETIRVEALLYTMLTPVDAVETRESTNEEGANIKEEVRGN